jgi:NifU-like protein involved in Fe-S cluster formation
MDLKELYQEIILDHGKNPRNKKNVTVSIKRQKDTTRFAVIKYTYF